MKTPRSNLIFGAIRRHFEPARPSGLGWAPGAGNTSQPQFCGHPHQRVGPDRAADYIALIQPQQNCLNESIMFQKLDYFFLFSALASFVASVGLWFLVNHDYGVYVGLWVPSILSLWVGVRVVLFAGATAPNISQKD